MDMVIDMIITTIHITMTKKMIPGHMRKMRSWEVTYRLNRRREQFQIIHTITGQFFMEEIPLSGQS